MLDTVREVHTPEGVALRLPAAGPVPRAFAWLIDFGIRIALVMVASMFLAFLGRFGVGVYLVFATLIIPALATVRISTERIRYRTAFLIAVVAYALGLAGSALLDLPSGPLIVWALAICGVAPAVVEWKKRPHSFKRS